MLEINKKLKTSRIGIDLIKSFEGLRLEPYYCTGNVLTIGYGHTKTVRPNMKITKEQAERLLQDDLVIFEQAVIRNVKVCLEQCEFDALVSFCFNVGIGNFTRSTLLKELNQMFFDRAADEFLRWNKSGGKVTAGLVRRREAERQMFLEAQK